MILLGGLGDEFIDVNNNLVHDANLGVSASVLTRVVLNPDGRGNNGCYDPPDSWTELGNTKMQNRGTSQGPGFLTFRPDWLGDRFNALEPLHRDTNGDQFFDPAAGDIFSVNDFNNNGQWDEGEDLAIDVNGNGFFDPEENWVQVSCVDPSQPSCGNPLNATGLINFSASGPAGFSLSYTDPEGVAYDVRWNIQQTPNSTRKIVVGVRAEPGALPAPPVHLRTLVAR